LQTRGLTLQVRMRSIAKVANAWSDLAGAHAQHSQSCKRAVGPCLCACAALPKLQTRGLTLLVRLRSIAKVANARSDLAGALAQLAKVANARSDLAGALAQHGQSCKRAV